MNQLLIATMAFTQGWLGVFFKIAIACVLVWGVVALIRSTEIVIPQPVVIVFTVLFCILVIFWLFELFQALL